MSRISVSDELGRLLLPPRSSTEYQKINADLHTPGGWDRKTGEPRSPAEMDAAVQAE
jgi:hypothetical protein